MSLNKSNLTDYAILSKQYKFITVISGLTAVHIFIETLCYWKQRGKTKCCHQNDDIKMRIQLWPASNMESDCLHWCASWHGPILVLQADSFVFIRLNFKVYLEQLNCYHADKTWMLCLSTEIPLNCFANVAA